MKKITRLRRPYILLFAFMMLILSWEYDRVNAALIENSIPVESIRLRILANSDSPRDQWIKHQLRQEIIQFMENRVNQYRDIHNAREQIQRSLPDINRLVEETLNKHGYTYSFSVELGQVPFPTKVYGNRVYPAGEYEALRITLGDGAGENWWCVLFPPLCFVDVAAGEAFAQEPEQAFEVETLEDTSTDQAEQTEPEVRFFAAELFSKIMDTISGWFKA